MSELEQIKARAAERVIALNSVFDQHGWPWKMQADLDRVIAMLEAKQAVIDRILVDMANLSLRCGQVENYASYTKDIEAQRDDARAAVKEYAEAFQQTADEAGELAAENKKLVDAAVALREAINHVKEHGIDHYSGSGPVIEKVLADTEWLEAHR